MSNVESCRRCGRFFEVHTGKRVAQVEKSHRRGWFCDTCSVTVALARRYNRPVRPLVDPVEWPT